MGQMKMQIFKGTVGELVSQAELQREGPIEGTCKESTIVLVGKSALNICHAR